MQNLWIFLVTLILGGALGLSTRPAVVHSVAPLGEKNYSHPKLVLAQESLNGTRINGTTRPQDSCASSWLAWATKKRQWESDHPIQSNWAIANLTSTVVGVLSTYSLCDGIPRIQIASTATERWISSITIPVVASSSTSSTAQDASITPFNMPYPSCHLGSAECSDEWYRQFKTDDTSDDFDPMWAISQFPLDGKSTQHFFGCAPPQEICRSPETALPSEIKVVGSPDGGCTVEAGRFALIYFPETIASSDLCANNGLGRYVTAPLPTNPRSPRLFSTSAIVIHTHNFNYPNVDFGAKDGFAHDITITGSPSFTFTSPSIYMAYDTLRASDRCSSIGSGFSSGIVALDANEVQSIAVRIRPLSWEGTDLQYAQAVAKDNFGMKFAHEGPDQVWTRDYLTRTVNMNDFGPNVPAAAYYEQSDCNWWDLHEDNQLCSTITEGRYFPNLVIPEKLKSLNPDWKDCTMVGGVQDPPITLPVADRILVPTLPALPDPEGTSSGAREGGHLVSGPMATPPVTITGEYGSDPTTVSTWVVLGSSTIAAAYYLGAQQSEARQGGGRFPEAQARIVIGSQTISMNAPAQTIAGRLMSLNDEGLIVEGIDTSHSGGSKTTIPLPKSQMEGALRTSRLLSVTSSGSGRDADRISASRVETEDMSRASTRMKSAASSNRLDGAIGKIRWSGFIWCLFSYYL